MSLTSLANSTAMLALQVAGMWRTVDTCAANTCSNVGTNVGHGNVMAVPATGGVCMGASSGMGAGWGSCGRPLLLVVARQFLHGAPMGTSVLHGSLHSLMPRLRRISGETCSPVTMCFAATWDTKARRDRTTKASGHLGMGQVVGQAGGGASSSSVSEFCTDACAIGASHPMRTGTLGSVTARDSVCLRGVVRDCSVAARVTRSWPWTVLRNSAPGSLGPG